MPRNCSSDIEAVIAFMDEAFEFENKEDIAKLEMTFNMTLLHYDDFAAARMFSQNLVLSLGK